MYVCHVVNKIYSLTHSLTYLLINLRSKLSLSGSANSGAVHTTTDGSSVAETRHAPTVTHATTAVLAVGVDVGVRVDGRRLTDIRSGAQKDEQGNGCTITPETTWCHPDTQHLCRTHVGVTTADQTEDG